jgi:hypothetical protein
VQYPAQYVPTAPLGHPPAPFPPTTPLGPGVPRYLCWLEMATRTDPASTIDSPCRDPPMTRMSAEVARLVAPREQVTLTRQRPVVARPGTRHRQTMCGERNDAPKGPACRFPGPTNTTSQVRIRDASTPRAPCCPGASRGVSSSISGVRTGRAALPIEALRRSAPPTVRTPTATVLLARPRPRNIPTNVAHSPTMVNGTVERRERGGSDLPPARPVRRLLVRAAAAGDIRDGSRESPRRRETLLYPASAQSTNPDRPAWAAVVRSQSDLGRR